VDPLAPRRFVRGGGIRLAAALGLVLLAANPAAAQLLTRSRWVGSFHHQTGDGEGNTMSQQYDLTMYRDQPGGLLYRFGTSLNYFSRPGETGVDLFRSRLFGEVRDRRWRLSGQYTPWQDVSATSATGREQRGQLHFDVSPVRAGALALDYKRQDREGLLGRSYYEDAQARVETHSEALTAGASVRRLNQGSDQAPTTVTTEARGAVSSHQRLNRAVVLQEAYDVVHTTTDNVERHTVYTTHQGNVGGTWTPYRRLRVGGNAFLRKGSTEDNAPGGDSRIDERDLVGRAEATPWTGLDLRLSREYHSRLAGERNETSDFLRAEALLRRPLYRGVGFQTGILNTTDLKSSGGWVPATTAFLILDGALRRGVAGRAELRVSQPTVIDVDGLTWRRLLQIRTIPSRASRFEITWWRDNLPRVQGAAQNETHWEFILGIKPSPASDVTVSHSRLDGTGRQMRQERYGALTLTWKAGDRTAVSANASRRASLLEPIKSTENLVGLDLTFFMPREFRTKLTWRHRTGLDLGTASSYGVTVDKTF